MKRITRRQFTGMLVAGAASTLPIAARTQGGGKVTLYMGPPEKTCTAITQGFEKKTGIKPTFLRLSAGEAVNRIRAEKNSPQASVLYGIGLPSMLTLKADGLLQPYKSPEAAAIPDRYKDPEGFWTGTDVDFIGIADPTGKPVYLNAAGRRMIGLAPDFPVEELQIQDCYPREIRSSATCS